jgi:hypothetical protein
VVVAIGNGSEYPPLTGILVRTRREVVFIPYTGIAGIGRWEVYLTTSGLQPHPLPDQDNLVALAGDLLDRKILDSDGAGIGRVSDLVLACKVDEILLVGADLSIRTLLRRLGTPWMRRRVAARRVYDWSAVGALYFLVRWDYSARAARVTARRTQPQTAGGREIRSLCTRLVKHRQHDIRHLVHWSRLPSPKLPRHREGVHIGTAADRVREVGRRLDAKLDQAQHRSGPPCSLLESRKSLVETCSGAADSRRRLEPALLNSYGIW